MKKPRIFKWFDGRRRRIRTADPLGVNDTLLTDNAVFTAFSWLLIPVCSPLFPGFLGRKRDGIRRRDGQASPMMS